MKIYKSIQEIDELFPGACVTIGNFDGVHKGHLQLFATVAEKAKARKGTSIAVTFDPHPLRILLKEGIKLISTVDHKEELIERAGIDILLVLPFSKEFAATTAERFVSDILVKALGVQELVVGYDYAFGKGRSGNIDFLRNQGKQYGFPVDVVEAHFIDGELVSSTRIRELVREGKMAAAANLLGRPYQIRGTVQVGRQRGGKVIGFPTANLKFNEEDLVPRHGVYVTEVMFENGRYGGILNIGYNPTFGEEELVAETHIFNFDKNIYGKPIRVNLLRFLRDERKFSGVESLTEQIRKDVEIAKGVLEEGHHG